MTADLPRDTLAEVIASWRGVTGRVNDNDRNRADHILHAGWRSPARVIRTVEELNACNDFATLHWVDDAGLPHAHIAAAMKEHVRQLVKLFPGQPMWPMTVIHEGNDL